MKVILSVDIHILLDTGLIVTDLQKNYGLAGVIPAVALAAVALPVTTSP
jgi:hypothetical protein